LQFTNKRGAEVTLERAYLHVGAVYLNELVPATGAGVQPCISSGIYAGQAFANLDVDLLTSSPQHFPDPGQGTENRARTAEVWLTGGDINATEDATVIFDIAGTSVQDAIAYPFEGEITIGSNRAVTPANSAEPGASPICQQRIVTPIAVDFTANDGGRLHLAIDPRAVLADVDFSRLTGTEIPDTNDGVGAAVFRGLQRDAGVYSFTWLDR
ncbi:MAG: hypothetical protein H7Z43_11950, partial [Clostridia bacterium]|nr:hypothetical protein [Deltaproteobacteria bacterium]